MKDVKCVVRFLVGENSTYRLRGPLMFLTNFPDLGTTGRETLLVADQISECLHEPTISICDAVSFVFCSQEGKLYSLKFNNVSKSLSKFVTVKELRNLRACI